MTGYESKKILVFLLLLTACNGEQDTAPPRLGIVQPSRGNDLEEETSTSPRVTRVDDLIAIVTSESAVTDDRQAVVDATLELGRLKAVEAAPYLAELLDFHLKASGEMRWNEIPPPEVPYPAVKALIQIGKPSIPVVLEALAKKERSRTFRSNARYTIITILGDDLDAARNVIMKAVEEQRKQLERVQALREELNP